jgi:glycosyltransferase involved in cell wall biosynthesis
MAVNAAIAFVANTSWSIYKFRLYLIERLLEKGFAIYVLAPRDAYTGKFEQLDGLTYIQLHHFHPKGVSPFRDYRLYRELVRHYRTIKPRLIFHYTIKANLYGTRAAARAGIPSISIITGLGYTFSGEGWLQRGVRIGYRRQLRKAAEVWFLNEDDRKTFTGRNLVPAANTFLLPGEGVDTEYFYPAPFAPHLPQTTITFLLIGRLIRHKGILEFVDAAKLLKGRQAPVQCQLLGFFDEESPVAIPRDQVEEWTANGIITYLGHTDDVRPFIEKADCIVLPSYREGMPLSLLEGASMCKALIATDTAGCRDLIKDGVNGYLCHVKDGVDLAAKMTAYLQQPPDEKRQLGIRGREHVLQHYTRETVAAIYLEKIKTLGVIPPEL